VKHDQAPRRGAPNIGYTLALAANTAILPPRPRLRRFLNGWSRSVGHRPVKIIHEVFTASFSPAKTAINGQIALFYPGAMGHASEVSFAS